MIKRSPYTIEAVALLCLQDAGFERGFGISTQLMKRLGGARQEFAPRTAMTPALGDDLE